MKERTRYHAYISYSHADERFAAWLQRALETWRIPSALATELGFSRIKPVFRDREDLHAAANLGESLRDALDQSAALIVVCSRNAAQSKWVNEEIKYFREKHGTSRIFSIIACDDPPECFPTALLGDLSSAQMEPLAADARREADGRKNALLKTISALLEVDFDKLKNRELRRRYQRMTIAAASGLTMTMVTLTLAILAYDARNDANRGRQSAEELISFMYGDLRSRLEPIGRLDVLEAVGDKSMDYYESLEADEFTPDVLLGQARVVRQIGEVRMSQSNIEEALASFELSNEQARRLLEQSTTPEAVEYEVSQSHFWVGYVNYELGRLDLARQHWESYLDLAQSLARRDPASDDYQIEVAYAHSNLGTLELRNYRFAEAAAHFQETMAIQEDIIEASPMALGPKDDLAGSLSWQGEIASDTGDVRLAITLFQREHELRTEIVNASDDAFQRELLANAAALLGYQLVLVGEIEAATKHVEQAYTLGAQLRDRDPTNARWRALYGFAAVDLSRIAMINGNLEQATSYINEAIDEFRRLRELTQLEAATLQGSITPALIQQARIFRYLGEYPKAKAVIEEALSILAETPNENDSFLEIAELRLLEGDLLAIEDNTQAANLAWSAGLQSLDSLPATYLNSSALLARAALLERTDRNSEASTLRDEIAQLGYQDQDRTLTSALIDGVPR